MKKQKINKVLIALDYDPTAKKIAETGYALANSMEAEVILLHVIADPEYYALNQYSPIMGFTGFVDIGPLQLNIMEDLKKASLHFLEKSKEHLGDKKIGLLVKEGGFSDTILETAGELQVDMIVMGSHSRRWLEKILMGNVTEKVLHHSKIPILIIPTKKN